MSPESLAIPRLTLPFDFAPRLPGSKSHANRALVAAALADGETVLRDVTFCDDVRRLTSGLATLGFDVVADEAGGTVRCRGGLPDGGGAATIDCGNAGTALRFLVSAATLVPGEWVLDGDDRMRRRPIGDLVAAWRDLGADIADSGGCPPVRLRGGRTDGGEVTLRAGSSSQFLSSMLLVASRLEGGLDVRLDGDLASAGYVDLTIGVLNAFGVEVERSAGTGRYRVGGAAGVAPGGLHVEPDWSAVGVWSVLAEMTGSRLRDDALERDSLQGDRALAGLIAGLRGDGDRSVDVAATPDQLMNLAVLAARRDGRTRFTGARNLRLKECDRLAVTVRELARAGIPAEVEDDGIVVTGSPTARAARFDPEADHRMAMAFAALGSLLDGAEMRDPGCVAKSYPGFFEDLDRAVRSPRCIAIVGMRGAGKSTLGAALADALELPFVDTDALFEERFGPIGAFVAREGWEAFRRREALLCAESVRPGAVAAVGGGAVETAEVRAHLVSAATVVWIDESDAVIRARLAAEPESRPSVTGAAPVDEVDELSTRRRPLYAGTAAHTLPPGEGPGERLRRALAALTCGW